MLETALSLSIYTNNNGVEEQDGKIDGEFQGNSDFSFMKPNMDLIKEEGDDLGEIVDGFVRKTVMSLYDTRKGDLQGAEEYYFRATTADPSDGEILSQYAQLVWELHRDQERASGYFKLAAQTAPKDSNILAAYAKFLWEVGDDEHEGSIQPDLAQVDLQKSIHLHPADEIVVGVDGGIDSPKFEAGAPINSADVEDYYKMMIEKDPSDPLFLKKYAQFLYQTKGDLQSAEEHYSLAILAYPQDGEMLLQYATNTLAAYARFLWTIDDE
uniref:Uncharacterized protein n=1 Tax=Chenopodium quinoa TaxID=63459 RepID=A0A803LS44_CHEQI